MKEGWGAGGSLVPSTVPGALEPLACAPSRWKIKSNRLLQRALCTLGRFVVYFCDMSSTFVGAAPVHFETLGRLLLAHVVYFWERGDHLCPYPSG